MSKRRYPWITFLLGIMFLAFGGYGVATGVFLLVTDSGLDRLWAAADLVGGSGFLVFGIAILIAVNRRPVKETPAS